MATTEIFNYSNVKAALSNVDSAKASAKQSLTNGTNALQSSIATGSDNAATALSGTSATAIKQKWDNLAEKFVEFTNYIDRTIEKAEQAASANQAFESESISSIG